MAVIILNTRGSHSVLVERDATYGEMVGGASHVNTESAESIWTRGTGRAAGLGGDGPWLAPTVGDVKRSSEVRLLECGPGQRDSRYF